MVAHFGWDRTGCAWRPARRHARRKRSLGTRHARLHHPPAAGSAAGHAGRGADRVCAVPLRRRSRQPDGRAGRHAGGPRQSAARPRARRCRGRAVRPLRWPRGALRFRHLLPAQAAGNRPDRRALSRHVRAGARGRAPGGGARHPDGRVHRHLPRQLALQAVPGGVADRHLAADLPDRHPADLSVRGDAGLAAVVRPRRGSADRLVDHRAAHGLRPQGADHAVDHARPVPDDADHAAGARRDAGGAAHRLHQASRARAGCPSGPSTSAMRCATR